MGRLFGTDGVRGVFGRDLTTDLARSLGRAAVTVLARERHSTPVFVIGRDTRTSGPVLEEALVEGITAIETVFRDALGGPNAPVRNLDQEPLRISARSANRALDACRDARQALEHNPNEGLLLERLLLHLPGGVGRAPG